MILFEESTSLSLSLIFDLILTKKERDGMMNYVSDGELNVKATEEDEREMQSRFKQQRQKRK